MASGQENSLTERELVRLVGRGDAGAQRELYQRYAAHLTSVASRYLVDRDRVKDVLQDAFIRIFEKFGTFRYRGEGSLKAWMSRIAVNGALQELRRRERLVAVEQLPAPVDDEDPDTDGVPLEVIQEMIKRMPDGYRTVFNLFVFEQMRHKEIAELLGIKENTSASQFLRAKAFLAKEIKEYRKLNDNV